MLRSECSTSPWRLAAAVAPTSSEAPILSRTPSLRFAWRRASRGRIALAVIGIACAAIGTGANRESRQWDLVRPLFNDREWRSRSSPSAGRPSRPRPVQRVPVGDAERPVFGALAPGARVGDATVTALEGIRDGFLHVHVALREGPVDLWIARLAGTNAHPPVSVGPYAIYSARTPIAHERIEPTMRAVAMALDADPARVPPQLRPLIADGRPR